jgi:hypothetical protein
MQHQRSSEFAAPFYVVMLLFFKRDRERRERRNRREAVQLEFQEELEVRT